MTRALCPFVLAAVACGSGAHDRSFTDAGSGTGAHDANTSSDSSRSLDAAIAIDAMPDARPIDAAPDPCAGVTCTTPPAAACTDAQTLVTYAATGTCNAGTCNYAPSSQACDHGCYGSACVGAATNACGVCDRDWQCDAALDHWSSFYDSDGLGCMDDRTGTVLRCDGSLDNDPDDSWMKTTWGMELLFGGVLGTHEVDCYPG